MGKYIFIMPAVSRLTGGPGAVAEYINELHNRNHSVKVYIPSPVWHGIIKFNWTENISPKFKTRKNKKFSLAIILIRLMLNCINPRKLRLMVNLIRLISKAIFSQHELKISDHLKAFRRAAGMILPYFDLPKVNSDQVVVATFWPTAFAATLSNARKKVYLMQHYEEVFYPEESEWYLVNILVRVTYDLPMHQSANSYWLKQKINKVHFRDPDITATNGIPYEYLSISGVLSNEIRSNDSIRIIAYARPEPWKGMAVVVRAIEILRKEFDIDLVFYGQIDDYWKSIAIHYKFEYLENFTYDELIGEIKKSDIAISGSWYESFPLPPLEAMFCGVPVVCSQEGTEEYAIDNMTAKIYKSGDHEDAARALRELIIDQNLRLKIKSNALKHAKQFNWEHAHIIRTNWIENIENVPTPKSKTIPLRLTRSIPAPSSVNISEGTRLIRDPNGHVFIEHLGVVRHLHTSDDVQRAKIKFDTEVIEVDFSEVIDKWRI